MAFPTLSASNQNGPSGFEAHVLSVTKPACAVGDRIAVVAIARTFSTAAVPIMTLGGFTTRLTGTVNPSLPYLAINVYDRVIDGSEGATFTLTCTDDDYLYAYAFNIGQTAYVTSAEQSSSGGFDSAHLLPNVIVSGDVLALGVLFGWADALTAGPAGWTLLHGPTDGLGYAWSRQVANPGISTTDMTPLDTDRWHAVTVAYEVDISTISGSFAVTDAADTSSFTGNSQISGTFAVTDIADTFAGDVDVEQIIGGTFAVTDVADTFVAVQADVVGSFAVTDEADNCGISANRYGGAPTVRREDGPVFLNRRRRRYFNPSRNPVTGP